MERHADQSRMSTLPIEAGNFESIFFEQPPVAAQAATTTEAAEHLSATRSDTSPFLPHPQLGHPQLGPTEAADIADTLQNGESCFRQQQARTRPPTSPTSADVRQPLPAQVSRPMLVARPSHALASVSHRRLHRQATLLSEALSEQTVAVPTCPSCSSLRVQQPRRQQRSSAQALCQPRTCCLQMTIHALASVLHHRLHR